MAIYNNVNGVKELADVKISKQKVTADGKLSVTIDALDESVTEDSIVKLFVFDAIASIVPLTTVTIG